MQTLTSENINWCDLVTFIIQNFDNHDLEICDQTLLFSKEDINFVSSNGNNLLHFACAGDSSILLSFFLPYCRNNINITNKFGETPLHIACAKEKLKSIKILLSNGSNINIVDQEEYTPFFTAVDSGNIEIVSFLLKTTLFNINFKNKYNQTALSIACLNHDIPMINLLLQNKAEIGNLILYLSTKPNTSIIIEVLLKFKENNIILYDRNYRNPLHFAVKFKNYKICKYLLKIKSNFSNEKDEFGKLPKDYITSKRSMLNDLFKLMN